MKAVTDLNGDISNELFRVSPISFGRLIREKISFCVSRGRSP